MASDRVEESRLPDFQFIKHLSLKDFPVFVLFEISKHFPPAHLAFLANKHYKKQYNDIGAWKEILFHEGNHWDIYDKDEGLIRQCVRWTHKTKNHSFFPFYITYEKYYDSYDTQDYKERISVNFEKRDNGQFGFVYLKTWKTRKEESLDLFKNGKIQLRWAVPVQDNYRNKAFREKKLLDIFFKIKKHFNLYP